MTRALQIVFIVLLSCLAVAVLLGITGLVVWGTTSVWQQIL